MIRLKETSLSGPSMAVRGRWRRACGGSLVVAGFFAVPADAQDLPDLQRELREMRQHYDAELKRLRRDYETRIERLVRMPDGRTVGSKLMSRHGPSRSASICCTVSVPTSNAAISGCAPANVFIAFGSLLAEAINSS